MAGGPYGGARREKNGEVVGVCILVAGVGCRVRSVPIKRLGCCAVEGTRNNSTMIYMAYV